MDVDTQNSGIKDNKIYTANHKGAENHSEPIGWMRQDGAVYRGYMLPPVAPIFRLLEILVGSFGIGAVANPKTSKRTCNARPVCLVGRSYSIAERR